MRTLFNFLKIISQRLIKFQLMHKIYKKYEKQAKFKHRSKIFECKSKNKTDK